MATRFEVAQAADVDIDSYPQTRKPDEDIRIRGGPRSLIRTHVRPFRWHSTICPTSFTY
jgi:hypothetical protein